MARVVVAWPTAEHNVRFPLFTVVVRGAKQCRQPL